MGEIRFNDRVMIAGYTGSGKSLLINYLFSISGGGAQRVLFDTKPEYFIPGVEPVSRVEQIDWKQPMIHVRLDSPEPAEVDRFFKAFNQRRRIVVYVHELSDLTGYDANKTPASVNAYLSKGRKYGRGMVGGTQRPVGIPKRAFTDIQHAMIFATGFPEDSDMKAAAMLAGMKVKDMAYVLGEIQAEWGEHAFIHVDRREPPETRVKACPPLSQSDLDAIIVDDPELF